MDYPIVDGRVQTRALEYHITDHCNLRCDHCCSFSPILKKWLADPAAFREDLLAVRRVVRPSFLKIVGGEPLLHPQLEELLAIAHELQVGARIQLTTNGLLLRQLSSRSWDCIQMLSVSLYPEPSLPRDLIRHVAREAARRNVEVSWKMQDKFTCLDRSSLATPAEAASTFAGCWIRHRCNSIKDGRFYSCTRPQYIRKFAADPQRFASDGVPVLTADAARIRQHLTQSEPLHSCFLCNGGDAPLDTHRQLTPQAIGAKRNLLVTLTAP
ncbi:MAG: radical SAM protein [Bryobacterales bacterium]|nr:radical SAM protein [Bryobacterales bacterium]